VVISERLGPLKYLVEMDKDRSWKRHIDQLGSRGDSPHPSPAAIAVPHAVESGFEDKEVSPEQLFLKDTTNEEPQTETSMMDCWWLAIVNVFINKRTSPKYITDF